MNLRLLMIAGMAMSACSQAQITGRAPPLTDLAESRELTAMQNPGLAPASADKVRHDAASLWAGGPTSLFGFRRAETVGDILTVVIEIDENAELDAGLDRSRISAEAMAVPSFLGLPQRIDERLPEGASLNAAVAATSTSQYKGSGGVSRSGDLELRVAATVVDVMRNGALLVEGRQEVRVNHELRELVITGLVKPEDISRGNEVVYDKLAAARISYGGRGVVSEVQTPRWGQRVADAVLPF